MIMVAGKFGVLVLGAALAASALGQEKPRLDRTEKILLIGDGITRGLDAFSTVRALQNPNNHETNVLLGAHAKNPFIVGAYSGVVVYGQFRLAQYLDRHNHRQLAHVLTAADIVYDGALTGHNLTLQPNLKAGEVRFNF